jgi:hypothetical protein
MGVFSHRGTYSVADYNAYTIFEHPTRYTAVFSLPGPPFPTSGYAEWSSTRIVVSTTFTSHAKIELIGLGMVVSQPTTTTPFDLSGGLITGFNSTMAAVGVFFSTEISGLSLSAAQFWSLTQAKAWHDIYVLAASGNDVMTGHFMHDFIEGWDGSDVLYGLEGDDSLWGNGDRDFLYGGDGNDILVGNDWAPGAFSALWNECWGGGGDDLLFTGGYGSGYLVGEGGVDRLWGAAQSDVLEGGSGGDFLIGGGGIDIFKVKSADMVAGEIDMILDFEDGIDYIQLAPATSYSLQDSAYGALLSVVVPGGSWGTIISQTTAFQVYDQIFLAA